VEKRKNDEKLLFLRKKHIVVVLNEFRYDFGNSRLLNAFFLFFFGVAAVWR